MAYATAVLVGVASVLLASTVLAATRPAFDRHRRNLLSRAARSERRRARLRLATKLRGDGFHLAIRGLWLSRRQAEQLRASFRVRTNTGRSFEADELLRHLGTESSEVYLLNAESGHGKTTFALALTLWRQRGRHDQLVPFYFNVSAADFKEDFDDWIARLSRATRAGAGGLTDRALLIIDGVNETLEAAAVVRIIADHRQSLHANRVTLMFTFSFRHRYYAGGLVSALKSAGFSTLRTLRFDEAEETSTSRYDLRFFPWLLDRKGSRLDVVTDFVNEYANSHPDWIRNRRDIATLIRWRRDHPGRVPPPPVRLTADRYLNREAGRHREELLGVAKIAFVLLGDELNACSLEHLVAEFNRLDEQESWDVERLKAQLQRRQAVLRATSEVELSLEAGKVHIHGEAAIRVLGALHLADALRRGITPDRLRGRTAYDLAAPFVPAALTWLGLKHLPIALERHLRDELAEADNAGRRTVPYSFFGRVIFSPYSAMGKTLMNLEVELFGSIIEAIDRDRSFTCAEAIRDARRTDTVPGPDPVLDQLFELISGASHGAVEPLLAFMSDPDATPLVKSQAAYLLIGWLGEHRTRPGHTDAGLRHEIIERLGTGDGNLHFRYHQAELLERLSNGARNDDAMRDAIAGAADAVAGASPFRDEASTPSICAILDQAVSRYAAGVSRINRENRGTSEMSFDTNSLQAILSEQMLDSGPLRQHSELHLECWEVTLGLFAKAFKSEGAAELWLSDAIVAALDHDLWIVRWWAFANLIDLIDWSAERGLWALAAGFADRIAAQVFRGDEPIGLKQRECAQVEGLLNKRFGDPAFQHLRDEIRDRRQDLVVDGGGRSFIDGYSTALGQPAEHNHDEYFRRVDRLLAQTI
jgi:hypothetical protein